MHMSMRISSVIISILAAGPTCFGQQPPQPAKPAIKTPWAVTVIHKVNLAKLIDRIQTQQRVRVGQIGSTMQDPLNITTGLVVDGDGHVLTRLVNLDPEDKNPDISVVTGDGTRLPATVVGGDCAT